MRKLFLTLFLLGVFTNCLGSTLQKNQAHKKVLILGAGLSGIIAGKTLMESGVDDFLILEGQDYIGGRIKQATMAGYTIELGANWIHFAKDKDTEPIWKLKKETNLKGIYCDYEDVIIRNDTGANITDMKSFHTMQTILGEVEEKQEERKKAMKTPISSRIGLALMGWKPKSPAKQLIQYYEIDFEFGRRAELVPFKELYTKETDFFVTDQRGIFTLFKGIYKKFEDKIKLRTTVTEVKYLPSIVEVTTSDGEVYTADFVLCTFSTGVLDSDMVKFYPPFPEWKREAIMKRPLSVYTKVFLKFPRKFWDNKEYILMASSERKGYYPVFQDLERPGILPNGSGILLITVTGDEGRRIEKQSFEKTKAEIVKMLRGVYGKNVSEPTEIYYEPWSLNPYIRGSFSDGNIGASSKDIEYLSKNLDRLYFSGEATSESWFGYMQGAYRTGEKNAKTIVQVIKCIEAGKKDCENSSGYTTSISTLLLLFSVITFNLWFEY